MTKQKGELNFLLTNLHVIELLTSDTIHFTSDTIHFGYHTFQTLAVLSFPHTAGAEVLWDTFIPDRTSDPVSLWHDTRRVSTVGERKPGTQHYTGMNGRNPAAHECNLRTT